MNISTLYKSLTSDTARAYQVFQLCRFASAMLVGMVLVYSGFSDQEVSQYEWFIFGVFAMSFFWSMGLQNALLSYYPDLESNKKKQLLGTLFLSFIIVVLPLSFIGAQFLFDSNGFKLLFVLYFSLSVPSTLLEQYFLLHRKSKQLFYFGIWLHAFFLVAVLIPALMVGSVESVLIGLVIWVFIRFVYAFIQMKDDMFYKVVPKVLWEFLGFGFPLMLYIMLGSGMDVLDGFIVEHYYGEDLFAKFRYGAKELPITALVIGALVSAMIPRLVVSFDDTLISLRSRIDNLMNWMFPLSIGLLIVSPYLYSFFYNEGYTLSAQIFNVYLLILISRLLTPQAVLYALKENKILMWTSFVELIVNLTMSLVLIRYFGILGIVYATVIAYTLEKVILVTYLHLSKNISIGQYINLGKYTIGSILLLVTYIIVSI